MERSGGYSDIPQDPRSRGRTAKPPQTNQALPPRDQPAPIETSHQDGHYTHRDYRYNEDRGEPYQVSGDPRYRPNQSDPRFAQRTGAYPESTPRESYQSPRDSASFSPEPESFSPDPRRALTKDAYPSRDLRRPNGNETYRESDSRDPRQSHEHHAYSQPDSRTSQPSRPQYEGMDQGWAPSPQKVPRERGWTDESPYRDPYDPRNAPPTQYAHDPRMSDDHALHRQPPAQISHRAPPTQSSRDPRDVPRARWFEAEFQVRFLFLS